jgi:hypothetical protein
MRYNSLNYIKGTFIMSIAKDSPFLKVVPGVAGKAFNPGTHANSTKEGLLSKPETLFKDTIDNKSGIFILFFFLSEIFAGKHGALNAAIILSAVSIPHMLTEFTNLRRATRKLRGHSAEKNIVDSSIWLLTFASTGLFLTVDVKLFNSGLTHSKFALASINIDNLFLMASISAQHCVDHFYLKLTDFPRLASSPNRNSNSTHAIRLADLFSPPPVTANTISSNRAAPPPPASRPGKSKYSTNLGIDLGLLI